MHASLALPNGRASDTRSIMYGVMMEYDRTVVLLDELIDVVGEDESHPLASLMEVLGVLIERYEDEHVPELIAD